MVRSAAVARISALTSMKPPMGIKKKNHVLLLPCCLGRNGRECLLFLKVGALKPLLVFLKLEPKVFKLTGTFISLVIQLV